MRRFDLPAGMASAEVPGFVALQLEDLAPFPIDQLRHGYVRASDGSAVFVYAAYSRRFSPEQTEAWPNSVFVLPDFAPALRFTFDRSTVVFLRSPTSMTALLFEGGRELPVRVAGRPLAQNAAPDAIDAVRARVLELVDGRTAHQLAYRVASPPQQRSQGLTFVLEPDGSGTAVQVVLPTNECWAMDIREAEFVAEQRTRLGFDLILWRVIQGVAAVIVVLLAGEFLLLGGWGYTKWLSNRVVSRKADVAQLDTKNSLTISLQDFRQRGLQPFEMLRAIAPGAGVGFSTATIEGARITISAEANSVADMNGYLGKVNAVAQVAAVETKDVQTRDNTTTFKLIITFKPGAFPAAAPAAVATNRTK